MVSARFISNVDVSEGEIVSAAQSPKTEETYVIIYFDGADMAAFEIEAETREQAVEAFKHTGRSEKDVFSIRP
ncbi:hypothetical protein SAMN04488136_1423 [Vibrio xiamenensis]|uniref:Uncharacterized protein n=1 Tax=Vibrio xiamenensis TaxID=861298 RepID=A0A1G8GXI3_9VIBR|nr:hypothetical protein SAMN04488136_1423 [Vibrio xiamenensis]